MPLWSSYGLRVGLSTLVDNLNTALLTSGTYLDRRIAEVTTVRDELTTARAEAV